MRYVIYNLDLAVRMLWRFKPQLMLYRVKALDMASFTCWIWNGNIHVVPPFEGVSLMLVIWSSLIGSRNESGVVSLTQAPTL